MRSFNQITQLCENISKAYKFIFYIHDDSGRLIFTVPKFKQEFIEYYNNSGIYEELKRLSDANGHPICLSSIMTDMWTGFSAPYEAGSLFICVGPVYYSTFSIDATGDDLLFRNMDEGMRQALLEHFEHIPRISYGEYTRLISFLYYSFCGNEFDNAKFGLATHSSTKNARQDVSLKQKQMLFDENMVHATYSFEKYMLSCIKEGNVEKLTRHLNINTDGKAGVLSPDNPLRQAKNLFIVSATIATRAAIEGGLNPEIALSLSDLFIQQVEQMKDEHQISLISSEMLFEFTRRVDELKIKNSYSKDINKCCRFIQENIHKNLRVADVAAYVHLSENYLSAKFKEETGKSLTGYIRSAKINEGKNLLQYTEKSIIEISELLSYSSQSLFTTTFKQETGLTPGQFRERGAKAGK